MISKLDYTVVDTTESKERKMGLIHPLGEIAHVKCNQTITHKLQF